MKLENWLELQVISFVYEEGDEEIAIKNYTLTRFNESNIEISVEFEHPDKLSKK